MKTMLALTGQRWLRLCGWVGVFAVAAATLGAQMPTPRIQSQITNELSPLKGSLQPQAQPQFDSGRMPSDTPLKGMTLVFNRSAAQQADLQQLIAAQQNPASPLYHKWLTPDQFAARFGVAQSDIDKVETWLQQQGFSIDSVSRSHTMIHFSGTAGQVELAFQTQMHYYTVNGAKHFAPSTVLSVPTAIAPVVAAITNLTDFRPHPMIIPNRLHPAFTSSQTGSVFFAPGDIKTAYGFSTLASGDIGTGQSIAVMGQSAVNVTDIHNFQNAAGLTVKDPTMVLVPGSGTSTIVSGGDEGESDLDLEWSGATAPGADIFFVYTGNSTNYSVFDSIAYAVDARLANIITISYGACETALSSSTASAVDQIFSQAASQGQTVIASSGDLGSTACYGDTANNLTTTQQQALAVNYPASSQYVTAVGGTEIAATNDKVGTYWQSASSTDLINSAISHIPEVAWNDDAYNLQSGCTSSCLSSTGGGASVFFGKPSWQKGVPGIPNDSHRDVPDISLYASPSFPGYLFCTSDTSDWIQANNNTNPPTVAQQASCNSGFRDSSTQYLTVAGGTSFSAPIFAGMVAILNQKQGYATGQGNVNPTLYTLASNTTTYGTVFYDITQGSSTVALGTGNQCLSNSTDCSSSSGSTTKYGTTAGYDLATGLGSFNFGLLAQTWPANTGSGASLISTTTQVSPTVASPAVNASDTLNITVTSTDGTTTPTGTVKLSIDQTVGSSGALTGGTTATVNLTAGSTAGTAVGTYSATFTTAGIHTVVATYSGDTAVAASTGAASISVGGGSTGTAAFKLSASPSTLTVSRGSAGNETITVTPSGGYTGTVYLSFTVSNPTALANLCYNFTTIAPDGSSGSVTVNGTAAATTQFTLDTNASNCASNSGYGGYGGYGYYGYSQKGMHSMRAIGHGNTSRNNSPNPAPFGVAFAGLFLAGFLGRRSRKFRTMAGLIALLAVGFAVSACGGGGIAAPSNPPKGTYTVTVTGSDSTSNSIPTSSTTFTFTID
jgi:subtilase family serine protease